MTQSGAFRAIVILAALLDALATFYSNLPLIIAENLLWLSSESIGDSRLASAIAANRLGALVPPHPLYDALYHYGSFSLSALASIGLLLFQNWARHLFLILTVLGVVASAVSGMAVSTPFELTLGRLVGLLDGAVLALAYITPLKDRFISGDKKVNRVRVTFPH